MLHLLHRLYRLKTRLSGSFTSDPKKREREHYTPNDMLIRRGGEGNNVCQLLERYGVQIIYHTFPFKQELKEIYTHEWMENTLHKTIDYSRIFGTFMRFEIPVVEKEDEFVLYTDIDVLFTSDIRLEDLPHPKVLAAGPEAEKDINRSKMFNAGVLVMNIAGMRQKYEIFKTWMRQRRINANNTIFDQGYLNELCFDDMELLPLEYNWKPYWGINNQAKIIHYHGMKPNCEIEGAGFTTDFAFIYRVLKENATGYSGYVYYFDRFFDYLDEKKDKASLCMHLQDVFNAYRDESETRKKQIAKQRKKRAKYKRLFMLSALLSACLLFILACFLIKRN